MTGAGDLSGLDPHSRNEAFSNRILRQVNEPLLWRDGQLRLVPGLALSWSNPSPSVWRVQLRSGVRFAGGEAFSARDVVFSVQRAQHLQSAIRHYAAPLGKAVVVSPLQVEFRTDFPNPVFLEQLALIPMMNEEWTRTKGCEAPASAKARQETPCTLAANGTGAMRITEWKAGQQTRLERNPLWWGDWSKASGSIDALMYRPASSAAARLAGLLGGDVDLVFDASPTEVVQLQKQPGYQVLKAVENRIVFIGFDQSSPRLRAAGALKDNPLKNVLVRKAMAHAVDHKNLLDKIHRGFAQSTGAMVMSGAVGHTLAQEQLLPYNPPLARKLLADAGYGKGFAINFACPTDRYPTDLPVCTALTAMWSQIGLKVNFITLPKTTYFERVAKAGDGFDVYLMSWGGATTDAAFTLGPLVQTRNAQGDGADNDGGISNALIDKALDEARHEMSPARRASALTGALLEHQAQVHDLPLHRQMLIWAARSGIEVPMRADGMLQFTTIRIKTPAGSR